MLMKENCLGAGLGHWDEGGLGKSPKDVNYTLCPCVFFEDHSDSPLGAAVTLAHELGHNFGMNHDTLERGCSCKTAADKGGCIMNPSTGQVPMLPAALRGGLQLEMCAGKQLSRERPSFLARAPMEASRKNSMVGANLRGSPRLQYIWHEAQALCWEVVGSDALCLEIANYHHAWF